MAADFEFAAGVGSQYGGLGGQVVLNNNDSKYFVDLGVFGGGLGFKTIVSGNEIHSLGAHIGKYKFIFGEEISTVSVIYNYHFDGFRQQGWEIGTGIAFVKRDRYKALFSNEYSEEQKSAALVFNVGYTF